MLEVCKSDGERMTETTKSEVDELLDAFAKVSILYVQQQLNMFKGEQSRLNQDMLRRLDKLELELNQTKEALTNSRKAYKELVSKLAGNGT